MQDIKDLLATVQTDCEELLSTTEEDSETLDRRREDFGALIGYSILLNECSVINAEVLKVMEAQIKDIHSYILGQ